MANSILEWDKEGERWLENGTRHGILFTSDGTTTSAGATQSETFKHKYGVATAWNGLTSATESPQGAEANDIYADDIKYASLRSAETFNGTIESFSYPEKEWGPCDGSYTPDDGSGISFGQQTRNTFGFAFESQVFNDTATDTDDKIKLHLWYGCTANPSDRQYQTINESPEGISFSWEITSTPVLLEGANAVEGLPKNAISTITVTKTATNHYDDLVKVLKGHYKTKNGESGEDPSEIAGGYLPCPKDVYAIVKNGYNFETCKPNEQPAPQYSADASGHRVDAQGNHVLDKYGRLINDASGDPVIEVDTDGRQVNVYGDLIVDKDGNYLDANGAKWIDPEVPSNS